MHRPSHSSRFDHPNITNSSLCNFLHSPVTSSPLGPNILLNTLFSKPHIFFPLLGSYQIISPGPRFSLWTFRNLIRFTVKSCLHLAQTPSWKVTPCRLSVIACSIYSQVPSISEAVPPSATWGRAMSWRKGPAFHGDICIVAGICPLSRVLICVEMQCNYTKFRRLVNWWRCR